MANDIETVLSIAGRHTTAGAAEETVIVNVDGVVGPILVPANQSLIISDWAICAPVATQWRLQQSNDGVTFYDIALGAIPGATDSPTLLIHPRTGWVVVGGANVSLRVRAETPGGASVVTTTLRGYRQTA
jgi:hypothetical protein